VGQVSADAWQHEAQIMRMIQLLEPAITNFGEESQASPDSSKRVGIAMLQQRSADSLGSDELEALNQSIADETEIKLWMLQSTLSEELDLTGYRSAESFWTLQGGGGTERPRKTKADPLELQTDFEVFPELGSTLALDDEIRRRDLMALYQEAKQMPMIWDVRKAAQKFARTFVGVQAEDLILDPLPPPPPAPPEPKLSATLSIKFETLPPEIQAQLEQKLGLQPPSDSVINQTLDHVKKIGEAAQAAKAAIAPPDEQAGANGTPPPGGPLQ
jgi:hypothetical protein